MNAAFSCRRHLSIIPYFPISIFRFFHFSILSLLFVLPSIYVRGQDFGRRERTFDVTHYRIDVRLDEAARRVDGTTEITLTPLRTAIDIVVLDAVSMRIRSVHMAATGSATDLRVDPGTEAAWSYDSTQLRVKLPRKLEHGEQAVLRIVYSCRPERGLYFISPSTSFPEDPRQIWTQGQGEDNRHWFPCYDFPNDKATSEVLVTLDSSLQTLSNGELLSRRENVDGTTTWHWSQTRPHCSYLVMLAAGRYGRFREVRDGIPVESWHYPDDDTTDVRRTYGDTADMLAFYSAYTRVPYPWAKYVQVPVRHFLYGGMENTSATVMADTRMVVDARAALDYDPQPLIAHELAHQWFGDLVTYVDWNNEWLNEGFATYFQQLWTEYRNGEGDFTLQRFNGIRSALDASDRGGRRAVVSTDRGGKPNTYSKGAAVLHMLRDIVGEEEFRRVITAWLERHAFGSVETNDFKRTIEECTGRNLQWFFRQWLYGTGYPDIAVTRAVNAIGDSLRVTFRQTQATDSLCGYFRLPLTVRLSDGRTERVWIDGDVTSVTFAIEEADDPYVEIDPENVVCGRIRVDYSEAELLRLLREARSPAQRILAAESLASPAASRLETPEVRTALFDAARDDVHREVRKAIAGLLADIQPPAISFGGDLRELFVELTRDSFSGVRSTALNGLNNFPDASLIPLFHRMLKDSSYYVEAAAMNCILSVDSLGGAALVSDRLEKDSYADILSLAAMDWVRTYRYGQLLPALHRLVRPGHSVSVRTKAFETLVLLHESREALLRTLLGWLDEPHVPIRGWAVSALRLFGEREARGILRERAAGEENPQIRILLRELYGL